MNTETIEPLNLQFGAADQKAVAVIEQAKLPSVKDAVLAQFKEAEASVTELANTYRNVAYPVETPKGLAAAKAARHDLRERGRFAVQRAEKAVKDEVNDLKKVMADEVVRLVAIVKPVEDAIDEQIKAREATLAAEKAERERIEAARKNKHLTNLATLRSYIAQGAGKTSDQLLRAAIGVANIEIDPAAWEEYTDEAINVRESVRAELIRMSDETAERERFAAEVERQRIENEQIAVQQKAEADRLAAYHAELQAERDRLAAEQAERDREQSRITLERDALAAATAEADRIDALATKIGDELADNMRMVSQPPPCFIPKSGVTKAEVEALLAKHDPASDAHEPAEVMTLDELGELLGFELSAEFVCNTLRIKLSATNPTRYLTRDLPRLFAALHNHLTKLENLTC